MSNKFNQGFIADSATRFSSAPMSDVEFSTMTATPMRLTTFNAGDIVPIYYSEVLPHDTFSIDLSFVIRQNTVLTPTMGQMQVDFYAFFVPNRVVNESWKNVQGENTSGMWTAPDVSLVPLYTTRSGASSVQVPVGSVADYYDYPTQAPIPAVVLQQCNDFVFRGYLEIWNEHFRDQNYQPPIPFSRLNVYEGFFEPKGMTISLDASSVSSSTTVPVSQVSDGSSPKGAIQESIFGAGSVNRQAFGVPPRASSWSALDAPLKANKLHDYFTSVLPSPQKGPEVTFNLAGTAPVNAVTLDNSFNSFGSVPFRLRFNGTLPYFHNDLVANRLSTGSNVGNVAAYNENSNTSDTAYLVDGWNLNMTADLSQVSAISVSDLRFGAAVQQVYETLARGGSRYREFVNSFFGLDVNNPFSDTSVCLGHISRNLDLYQTAQTSPSAEGSTPQGNLAAFGYTSNGGHLFTKTFVEHGYVHIFAVVRHKNVYSSFMSRDKFRLNTLDFYLPQLANISEQPVYTREINPFYTDSDAVFGFQEAWSEYRFEPDRVSALMRPGVDGSLALWNYADDFDSGLAIADDNWLKSNSAAVLDRSLAVTSSKAPQFKGQFLFKVTKERPMPTYSVPGLDVI